MSGFYLSRRSKNNLRGVHPDLVAVVKRAIQITKVDFVVTEGLRTIERQRQLKAAGASRTLNSRHITGHAVDVAALVGRDVRWDWTCYLAIAEAFKTASAELSVPVRWGGSWKELSAHSLPITAAILSRSFPDGPHFELPARAYP